VQGFDLDPDVRWKMPSPLDEEKRSGVGPQSDKRRGHVTVTKTLLLLLLSSASR